jgi:hypothetical protein
VAISAHRTAYAAGDVRLEGLRYLGALCCGIATSRYIEHINACGREEFGKTNATFNIPRRFSSILEPIGSRETDPEQYRCRNGLANGFDDLK